MGRSRDQSKEGEPAVLRGIKKRGLYFHPRMSKKKWKRRERWKRKHFSTPITIFIFFLFLFPVSHPDPTTLDHHHRNNDGLLAKLNALSLSLSYFSSSSLSHRKADLLFIFPWEREVGKNIESSPNRLLYAPGDRKKYGRGNCPNIRIHLSSE